MSLENMTYSDKWDLFRGKVCKYLAMHGYIKNPWELASSLDMSFDEISINDVSEWDEAIEQELIEYKTKEGKDLFLC